MGKKAKKRVYEGRPGLHIRTIYTERKDVVILFTEDMPLSYRSFVEKATGKRPDGQVLHINENGKLPERATKWSCSLRGKFYFGRTDPYDPSSDHRPPVIHVSGAHYSWWNATMRNPVGPRF